MQKPQLIPILSGTTVIKKFDDSSYLLVEENYGYRLKINKNIHALLCLVDGKRTLIEIVKTYNEQGPDNISIDFIYSFLYDKLGKYGVIVLQDKEIRPIGKPSYLKLSFVILPPQFISKITPHLSFLFQKKIMIALISFSLVVLSFTIITWHEIIQQEFNKITLTGFSFYLLLFLCNCIVHEFGHATAVHKFGAKHGGIGFGFYLFVPVFFADVTDAWSLEKDKRVIVNLAGIYFEFIFSGILIIFFTLFQQYNLIPLIVILFAKTLYNLNPFFRTDGYWVLSDSVNIPNLRQKSDSALRAVFLYILGKEKSVNKRKCTLAAYSAISWGIILFFMASLLIYNPESILYFPIQLFNILTSLYNGSLNYSIANFWGLSISFVFYYLLIRFMIKLLKKQNKRNGC